MEILITCNSSHPRREFVLQSCSGVLSDLLGSQFDEPATVDTKFVVLIDDDPKIPNWMRVHGMRETLWKHGFGVDVAGGDVSVVATLASGLQDIVIEMFRTTVPRCPGHPHPLAVVARDTAEWQCPQDARHFRCPVGAYPQQTG
ncbi:hypothetical protein [Amycolatopsis pigmentata]|uniref:Uncharacterized protein n=1 Tax=Amycolatopsis pigmentata TaxID=450801 RepID=A0ABW5G7B7_9PSEU